jgi:protein involved in polysaccharide export with SLBB domain
MTMSRTWMMLATVAALGCAGARTPGGAELAAAASAARKGADNYRVSRADLLEITVYPDAQLNRKIRVAADGSISLPLIGTAQVAGKTVPEAENLLETRFASYLVAPHVSLVVSEFGSRQIFVLGEVQKPGSYPLPEGARMSGLQAVSTAGGFTNTAAPRRAILLRPNAGGVQKAVDLKAATKGRADADVVLEPNDILYVPQSLF